MSRAQSFLPSPGHNASYTLIQEPRPLPAGSSITHLFEYENWKTLEKYIETDVGNYLQKLFGMLAELRAERLSQVRLYCKFCESLGNSSLTFKFEA